MDEVEQLVSRAVKAATDELRVELNEVREENRKLKVRMTDMERALDKNEQYSRKTSLILSGKSIPVPQTNEPEPPAETKAIAAEMIKKKLKVDMQGPIVACHRLKNKKRILVKFQDLSDRDAVYQARFQQEQSGDDRVIIHENLTETRAQMIRTLGAMREKNLVTNYHTKNGNIFARNSHEKRYTNIEPWFTESEIMHAMDAAPMKQARNPGQPGGSDRFLRSQTLSNIPPGHVASLADYLVEKPPKKQKPGK